MHPKKTNIILIGMPGSGKSTVGVILAKSLCRQFVDTDILIQNEQQRTLQAIIDSEGSTALRNIEEQVLLKVNRKNHIIATGGSAAYSHQAMIHLKKEGLTVFLHTDLEVLKSRIQNYETRGLAKRKDQTFQDLFNERSQLYNKYADITVQSSSITQDQVCEKIITQLDFQIYKPLSMRLQNEFDTVKIMVELYCRDHHKTATVTCNRCVELTEYVRKRLVDCPFKEQKATCGNCTVHCYKKDMQQRVKEVMRYSGPKMIWKHPVKAIQHLINSKKEPPKVDSGKR